MDADDEHEDEEGHVSINATTTDNNNPGVKFTKGGNKKSTGTDAGMKVRKYLTFVTRKLITLSDKISADKTAENLTCCRKLCPPKGLVRRKFCPPKYFVH